MKIKLLCRKEKEESYRRQLQNGEIRFGSPADLILMEPQFLLDELLIREEEGISIVSPQETLYVESLQNQLKLHAKQKTYHTRGTLYQMEASLYPKGFLRIHKSYLVNRRHIAMIKTSLNMKFVLVLSDGSHLEVSRSYYYQFKEEIGF